VQFIGGEAVQAYKAWRDKGNKPPRTNPYFVPDDVGKMIHARHRRVCFNACGSLISWASCKIARSRCPIAVGPCWSHFFPVPPLHAHADHRLEPRHAGTARRRRAIACVDLAHVTRDTACDSAPASGMGKGGTGNKWLQRNGPGNDEAGQRDLAILHGLPRK